MLLKIDMHVHTHHSDSTASVDDIIKMAKRKGLDGLAITDHNTIKGAEEALAKKQSGLIVIPGEEVDTDRGHILALGIGEAIPKGLTIVEAISQIRSQKGLAIIPHPTIPLFSKLKESDLRRLPLDGLEVFSAISPLANHYLLKNMDIAKRLKLPMLAGSDSHFPETVGDAYTIVDSRSCDLSDVLDAVRSGRTSIGCRPSKLNFKIKMIIGLAISFFNQFRGCKDG